MAAQQQQQWTSPASQQELLHLAARLSQGSQQTLEEDLARLAALADSPPSTDEDTERRRLGARHCLQELTAGRPLPTFDADFSDTTPLASIQWTKRIEFVIMQCKMRLNDVLAHQEELLEQGAASLEAARQSARAASFSERRLERAWLPASDYFRHWQDSSSWLERCSLLELLQAALRSGCCCCWLAAWRCQRGLVGMEVAHERQQAAQPAQQAAQPAPQAALPAQAAQPAQPPAQQGMQGLLQPLL